MTHPDFSFLPFAFALNATLAASVKASLTPLFILAEHSRYRSAYIFPRLLAPRPNRQTMATIP